MMLKGLIALSTVVLLFTSTFAWAQNLPPVADAGPDRNIFVDDLITLEGSATDPDGDFIVDWQWIIESAPEGSSHYISDLFIPDPVFSTDTPGDYILSLVACDALLCSEPDMVTIHVTGYEVHEISQEQGRYPMINDRRDCIWIGASGGLYFYDAFTGETKLLDAAATIFSGYEINNNGDVGWHAPWRSTVEDTEVYVYDHSSRTNIQITNNDLEDRFYTITDDGTVYFVTKQADDTFILNTYSIDTGVTTVADLYQFAQWPKAINANGDVLWLDVNSSSRGLYLYSAATGITNLVSILGSNVVDPSLNDRGDVSYRLFATDYHAIMFYDATTGQTKELTRGARNSVWEPKTSNNGNVVWTGDDTADNIHYYHYLTDTVEQLTFLADNSVTGYWDKDINDWGDSAWVDWTRYRTSGTELNIYLNEEGRVEVINNVTDPEWPQINNNGDAVFEGVNSLGTGQGVYLATRAATVDEVVNTIEELTTDGSLDTATAEELQTSFDEAMEALSAGDETTAEKKIDKFEDDIDKAEKKGDLDSEDAKKLEDALQEVVNSN